MFQLCYMGRQKTKICVVCGKDFLGIESAYTCGTACRTYMSRMVAKGKKPEFILIAKSKGQKVPTFEKKEKKSEKPKEKSLIEFKEPTQESYDAKSISNLTFDEAGKTEPPLTKEQVIAKISELNLEKAKLKLERCPQGKHPKQYILEKEVRENELDDKIKAWECQLK